MKNRVLICGPSKKTRGGITSVIQAYQESNIWTQWDCIWIETYIDKNYIYKFLYFITSILKFIYYLPTCKIVHIHFSWYISAFRKSIFFFLAFILNKKIIVHLHSGAEHILESKVKFIYRYYFRNADLTIFLALAIKNKIEESFYIANSFILYNPYTNKISHLNEFTYSKNHSILFAGTIKEEKGVTDLILAFSSIATKFPKWRLVLAGNGDIEKYKTLCKKINLYNQIEFKGWVTGNAKEILFRNASIFCLPSYTEGFPMAVLDAWAFGLPVITTSVGGLIDVLINGENSLIFEPGDINTLASHLQKLMLNEDICKRISEKSIELSKRSFSINKISEQLNDIYLKLI